MNKSNPSQRLKRRSIPSTVRQLVLLEAGYKCANPSCRHILTLELHHIVWVKEGGTNDPHNLVALCPNCHALHTAGHIPTDAIKTWKSLLVSLNNPNRASADLLLVLYQEEQRIAAGTDQANQPPFRFTGDGLTMLSGLLVSGLVEITKRFSGASFWADGSGPSFEVGLTDAGRQLVEAWLSGRSDAITIALSGGSSSASRDAGFTAPSRSAEAPKPLL